jgi:transitional endoplasmic reticulum ATPase
MLEVRMDGFLSALTEVEPSAIREVFVDLPNVKWTDVGGLEDVKQHLKEAVEWPLKYPDLFTAAGITPPKGILLAGPPGCGKTLLAKAVATESGTNFISVKGPALLSKFVGESEKGMREVFHKARQAAPCIIFFDEIDSLVPARGGGTADSHVTERILSQFLAEFDGIEELKGVLILGATNRLDILDPAVVRPGRFDEIIEMVMPNEKGREAIFGVHLAGKPVAKDAKLKELAANTNGFSGADIASVVKRAAMKTVRRAIASLDKTPGGEKIEILKSDLLAAIQETFGK